MLTTKPSETHARQRCWQRYGVELTDELKHRLIREIGRARRRFAPLKLKGKPKPVFAIRHSAADPRREFWAVTLDDVTFRIVYEPRARVIVTFLPPIE